MSKWSSRLAALTTGLLLALTGHFAWRWHQPLSLCDIDRAPDKYGGRLVRIRVLVSNDVFIGSPLGSGPHISAFSACHGQDELPGATVDLNEQQISSVRETRHLWRQEQENLKFYISDVILVGRFEPPDGMLHCFSPKYHISNASIERVISTEEVPSEQREWIKSKAH